MACSPQRLRDRHFALPPTNGVEPRECERRSDQFRGQKGDQKKCGIKTQKPPHRPPFLLMLRLDLVFLKKHALDASVPQWKIATLGHIPPPGFF